MIFSLSLQKHVFLLLLTKEPDHNFLLTSEGKHAGKFSMTQINTIGPFPILEPLEQKIKEYYEMQERRTTDSEVQRLPYGRSGRRGNGQVASSIQEQTGLLN